MACYARTVSEDIRQKAELSRKEAEEFIERELEISSVECALMSEAMQFVKLLMRVIDNMRIV